MTLGVEAVLRAQGAGPSVRRRGRLAALAEQAIRTGVPLLRRASVSRRLRIVRVVHSRVSLAGGATISGPLVSSQLGPAREVVIVTATVGSGIGDAIQAAARGSASLALALEGVATAALEAWVAELHANLHRAEAERGWQAGPAIGPGMEGWPLDPGQRELFAVVGDEGPVRLLESGMMWPRHSLSFVVGLGP
ncbi:MAG TPA: hypothetical protein VF862_05395, partial [Gemmatimonadales bacterium]